MSNRKDACVPRPKKDGGTYWCKIGTAWLNDKGWKIDFDALPITDAEGRCSVFLFEPKSKQDAPF